MRWGRWRRPRQARHGSSGEVYHLFKLVIVIVSLFFCYLRYKLRFVKGGSHVVLTGFLLPSLLISPSASSILYCCPRFLQLLSVSITVAVAHQ